MTFITCWFMVLTHTPPYTYIFLFHISGTCIYRYVLFKLYLFGLSINFNEPRPLLNKNSLRKMMVFSYDKNINQSFKFNFQKNNFDSYPWYIINACISKSNYLMSLSLLRLLGYLMQLSSSFVVRCGLCVKILHHGSWVYTRVWSQYGL